MDDFSKYQHMFSEGKTPHEIYLAAKLYFAASIRLLRSIFGLSFVEAKEVIVTTDSDYSSLSEYQEQFVEVPEELLPLDDSNKFAP